MHHVILNLHDIYTGMELRILGEKVIIKLYCGLRLLIVACLLECYRINNNKTLTTVALCFILTELLVKEVMF